MILLNGQLLKERWYLRTQMKGIAKEIIVITYSLVVTDERLEQEQERNKEHGVRISDDKVWRTIIKERIIELIGDEKKKSSFFIYEGTVRCFCRFGPFFIIKRLPM